MHYLISFNIIGHQPDVDKIYLYAKEPYEAKYLLFINKCHGAELKYCNDSKAFIESRMIWMIFIKIWKNTVQIRNVKY